MAKQRLARGGGSVFWSEAKQTWIYRAVVGFRPDGSVRPTEGRARTQAEAVRKKREAETNDRQADPTRTTVGQYLTQWLEQTKPKVRESTWRSYESTLRLHLMPNVGGITLAAFSTPDVNRLFAKLPKDGMTAGTATKVSQFLASAMEAAVREGIVKYAPTRGASKPRVTRPVIEVFSDDEIRAIFAAVKSHRYEAMILTAIGTSARQGELFALQTSDVELRAGVIHIRRSLKQSTGEFIVYPRRRNAEFARSPCLRSSKRSSPDIWRRAHRAFSSPARPARTSAIRTSSVATGGRS